MDFFAKTSVRFCLAVSGSAGLLWLATGLEPCWLLLWIAPIPILAFALRADWLASASAAFLAWAAGALNLWAYFHGLLGMPAGVVVMVVAVPALAWMAAVSAFRALARRGQIGWAMVALPAIYTAYEGLVAAQSPHGTAGSLAYSQLNCLPLLQLASVTGPSGLTFTVLAFAATASVGLVAGRRARTPILVSLAATAALLAWGAIRLASPPSGPTVTVGLAVSDAADRLWMAKPGAKTRDQWEAYAEPVRSLAQAGAAVVVLPEKLGVMNESDTDSDARLQRLAEANRVQLVVGIDRETGRQGYNEARVYTPGKAIVSYDKEHLLPPFENHYTPGTGLTVLPASEGIRGVAICKDMDFPSPARDYGKAGIGLLLVPAWDFGIDRIFHGHMAIMRAVESGFSLARSAKAGYLTVCDNRGRVIAERRSDEAPFTTLLVTVPAGHDSTLYLRWGAGFADGIFALAVLCLVRLGVRPKNH